MALEVLIFDVDGTLANTEKDGHRVAFNAAFAEAGLDWYWDEALYGQLLAVTGGKERIKYHASKTRHYTELLDLGQIPLRPGVLRLLEEARAAGLRLAIATTTTPVNVSALLRNAISSDAETWFEVIGAGDAVRDKKPAADIYHYVLEELAVRPENCLAFEDSENGLRSSLGASLPTIVTINDYTKDHNFDDALIVLDEMGEPDHPFRVLSDKSVNGARYLDLALLRKLHQEKQ